jgi:rare lipoprotein A
MGRWLVILSLAMLQCPDIAAAEPQSPGKSGIPLPKPRPARRAPAVTAEATPASPAAEAPAKAPSIHESASGVPRDVPVEQPGSRTEDRAWALRPAIEADEPPPSIRRGGGCNGGKRVISAYYWEGKQTASGQPFDPKGLTAAHRTLPFGTRLNVSNPRTGKSVIVVINDRGPFVSGIELDLSLGAAQALGMSGTGAVCIE